MGKNDVIDSVRKYKDLVVAHFDNATIYLYGSYGIEPVLIDAKHPSPLYEDILRTGIRI